MKEFVRRPWMTPGDLAPGDTNCLQRDWLDLELETVEGPQSPSFEIAFDALWEQFGEAGEMERREVLEERMAWNPSKMTDGHAMHYEMMLVRCGDRIAAVTDQTAILVEGSTNVIVHHSHILVAPEWRRTGLAGWVRALPLMTARKVLREHGHGESGTMTIVAEMEHHDPGDPATRIRLAAMEKAGYSKIDPGRVSYFQPDFRAHNKPGLGNSGPVPLALVLRRVGREEESIVAGCEIRRIANALYHMYAHGLRAADIAAVRKSLDGYPANEEKVRLLPPTA